MTEPWFVTSAEEADRKALASVDQLADAVARVVMLARALASRGRVVDLAGLDQQVGLLCARALDLPPTQGRAARPRLLGLRAELDALAAALRPAEG